LKLAKIRDTVRKLLALDDASAPEAAPEQQSNEPIIPLPMRDHIADAVSADPYAVKGLKCSQCNYHGIARVGIGQSRCQMCGFQWRDQELEMPDCTRTAMLNGYQPLTASQVLDRLRGRSCWR
jgi:hypothetical protein